MEETKRERGVPVWLSEYDEGYCVVVLFLHCRRKMKKSYDGWFEITGLVLVEMVEAEKENLYLFKI